MKKSKKTAALLVVDMQQKFLTPSTSHIIPYVLWCANRTKFDLVVATRYRTSAWSPFSHLLQIGSPPKAPEVLIGGELMDAATIMVDKMRGSSESEIEDVLVRNGTGSVTIVGTGTDHHMLDVVSCLSSCDGLEVFVDTLGCASVNGAVENQRALDEMSRMVGSDHMVMIDSFQRR